MTKFFFPIFYCIILFSPFSAAELSHKKLFAADQSSSHLIQKTPFLVLKKKPLFRDNKILNTARIAGSSNNSAPSYQSSSSPKNILFLELLGKGFLYSVDYNRIVSDSISMGFGVSYTTLGATAILVSTNASVTQLPIYTNLYLTGNRHRSYLSGGLNIMSISLSAGLTQKVSLSSEAENTGVNTASVEDFVNNLQVETNATLALPQVGLGYEYRNPSGLLFRLTLYGTYFNQLIPFAGLSLGAIF